MAASLPPLSAEQVAVLESIAKKQRPLIEAAIAATSARRPGAKQVIAAPLDSDVLAWLKTFGDGYSTRINGILRAVMQGRL